MTMSKAAIAAMLAAALTVTAARADPAADLEKMRTLGNQLSEDLITCSAFFILSAQGGRNRGKPEDLKTAEDAEEIGERAMMFAQTIAKSIGQKPEVAMLRYRQSLQSLLDEMDNHFMNYSVLSSKYLQNCADLIRDPEATVARRLGIHTKAEAPAPIPITIDPFTRAVAERNGFQIQVFKVQVADGRVLLVPSVDEQAAMEVAAAWAKANPLK